MARIRSIKPEFWTSEQVVELSPTARLLFVGMWTFCDDQGVHPASSKTLKMEVFPGDDFSISDIEKMVSEILNAQLIAEYQASDCKSYWHVTGWGKHQKVEKPNFKHPAPPKFADQSPTNRRPIADQSTPGVGKGREGMGIGNGGEGEFVESPPAPQHPEVKNENTPVDPYSAIRSTIQAWQDADRSVQLKKIAAAQNFIADINPEITRFITNNLAKEPYRTRIILNPLNFFLEQFPGWLALPAAQRASKAHSTQNNPSGAQYSKPAERPENADEHMARPAALQLIKTHAPDIDPDSWTEKHFQSIQSKTSQRAATEIILAIAKTIRDGPRPPRTNGNAQEVAVPNLININGL